MSYDPKIYIQPTTVSSALTKITFNAQVSDSSGKILKRIATTVSAKSAITDEDQVTQGVKSALESMFEEIAKEIKR